MATRARRDKRGRIRWQVTWYDLDKILRGYTLPPGSTLADAKRKEREILHLRDDGIDWRPADSPPPTATIRRLIDGWSTYRKGVVRSPNTASTEASAGKLFLHHREVVRGAPADALVSALTKGDLHAYYAWLLTAPPHGRGVSAGHAGRAVRYVLKAWRWGYESGDYPGTPLPPLQLETRRPDRKRTFAATWEQIDQIIEAAGDARPEVRKALVLMRYTGLRISQALRLTWDDVDLEEGWLTIRPELGKTANERAGREVPMSSHLITELAAWGTREGRLATVGYQTMQYRLYAAWTASGLPDRLWRQRTSHAFRRAFESGLKSLGVDRDALEYYVGHDLGTYGVYVDPEDLDLLAVADAIPAIGAGGTVRSLRRRRAR